MYQGNVTTLQMLPPCTDALLEAAWSGCIPFIQPSANLTVDFDYPCKIIYMVEPYETILSGV